MKIVWVTIICDIQFMYLAFIVTNKVHKLNKLFFANIFKHENVIILFIKNTGGEIVVL